MVKIVKNPGNGRLNNLNDPVLNVLIYQPNSISLMEAVTLQTVMTYGRKPHNSITNVYQQISAW